MIDEKGGGHKISQAELKKRIHIINPNFPMSELGTLTNNKTELKAKELYEMLKDNELENFDPLEEAFKLLDPEGKGELNIGRLKSLFKALGYGDIQKKDTEILIECLDVDKDGKITIDDFKEIFKFMEEKEREEREAEEKQEEED